METDKKVIIFGVGNNAEVAYYYLKNDTKDDVVAFALDKEYIKENTKFGLPIVDFLNLKNIYPPDKYYFFAPCSGTNLNRYRERIYNESKKMGYKLYTYISSKANVYTKDIGENCFILENCNIQPHTSIGNNCVIWSGSNILHHTKVEDHIFLSSNVVVCGLSKIKKYSWLGANSTIKDNIIIDEGTVVGMASAIIRNTEKNSIYVGVPGKKIKDCDENIIL